MKAGDILTKENLRRIRPGNGLPAKYYEQYLGRKINQNLKKGTPLKHQYFS
jgi:N-acetylneuraminate synthase